MKEISINELPRYSPWPSRLLGAEEFSRGKRTVGDQLREYDKSKYAACLKYARAHPHATLENIKWFERGGKRQPSRCVSMDQKLYETDIVSAYKVREKQFLQRMRPLMQSCDTVIELGAGYGYNLALLKQKFPRHAYLGGELSPNAISLAKRLYPSTDVPVGHFNFYDKTYRIFDAAASSRILVLTYHASEMLLDARIFLDRLAKRRSQITAVAQFEPIFELSDTKDLLGLLRRKYIEANKYNTNLLTALRARKGIKIIRTHYDIFGTNPLFPESFIEWKFV